MTHFFLPMWNDTLWQLQKSLCLFPSIFFTLKDSVHYLWANNWRGEGNFISNHFLCLFCTLFSLLELFPTCLLFSDTTLAIEDSCKRPCLFNCNKKNNFVFKLVCNEAIHLIKRIFLHLKVVLVSSMNAKLEKSTYAISLWQK